MTEKEGISRRVCVCLSAGVLFPSSCLSIAYPSYTIPFLSVFGFTSFSMVAGLPISLNPDCHQVCIGTEEGGTGLEGDGDVVWKMCRGLNGTLRFGTNDTYRIACG